MAAWDVQLYEKYRQIVAVAVLVMLVSSLSTTKQLVGDQGPDREPCGSLR
jgi:hypothetical protein